MTLTLLGTCVALLPALCRGGLLTLCCAHEKPRSDDATCRQDCCDKEGGNPQDDPSAPDAPVRERCGPCADLCSAVIKPVDATDGAAAPTISSEPCALDVACASPAVRTGDRLSRVEFYPALPRLPYPASDRPLRI
ncbi:MAG: hypothetical protein KJ057_08045 [Phycisphaerae bacterium]|nr:MAG: hypothetical protein F9K17_04025 [Phycisphaerae bacterium]MBE7456289.1 hypothetical protein [Planctomycetia bacterium]MCK6464838.1 hypothetical protein [Phycisphaerae bacterium]MCL4718408.1 hypothetical protein [Phycisphaerae bacterium]NUQ08680.1 hypothetical protein [Phycisphaerae bacterium]